jgi:hypothetical protein
VTKRPKLIIPAIVLGLALLAVTAIYWIDSAGSLPSFLPGYEEGSTHHHFKHGLAALILALGCFVFAWFQSGGGPPAKGESEAPSASGGSPPPGSP